MSLYYAIILLVLSIIILWYYKYRGSGGSHSFPILAQYSRDLTQLAREGRLDPVVGREKEIGRVIQILSRRTKNNPVLVGKTGVGKTAIAEGLAQAIVGKEVPRGLENKKVLALDLSGIVAGTKFRGEFEQRLKKITNEIIQANRTIILFIDEIHTLAEAGEATGAIDADDILKPPLARGDLQVVGATTLEEYKKFIKTDATLDRRLQPVLVEEPTPSQTIKILWGIKGRYETHHGVKIGEEAIKEAVRLSKKYLSNRYFPDKAIDLIDEACAKVRIERVFTKTNKKTSTQGEKIKKSDRLIVTAKDIGEVVKNYVRL